MPADLPADWRQTGIPLTLAEIRAGITPEKRAALKEVLRVDVLMRELVCLGQSGEGPNSHNQTQLTVHGDKPGDD